MPKLLVSVRSADEAQGALEGGASIIDVKEPSLGSLGPASAATIDSVVARINGRLPVSVALGDLKADVGQNAKSKSAFGNLSFASCNFRRLSYVKWGLAGCGDGWQLMLLDAARKPAISSPHYLPVAVAYADWQQAQAPNPDALLAFVSNHAWPVFLLDTYKKDGRTLLDWMSLKEVGRLCEQCQRDGIELALAGSLGMDQIEALLPFQPDIFAVRGAACRGNDRTDTIDPRRVRLLVDMISSSQAILES
jgi:uncharacterized protein (UPF0264 family)